MGLETGITWTDSTLNFWHGCKKVSPGCKYCYMYRGKERFNVDPTNGHFILPRQGLPGMYFLCVCSDGMGWEHVSVSIPTEKRCPTWPEMCYIKSLFWGSEDVVLQFHPAEEDYVNNHPFCLHLWRAVGVKQPVPPPFLVGVINK